MILKSKKMKNISLIVLTILLFWFLFFLEGNQINKDIKSAKSYEEVLAYQYEKTPGLKRAEELDLVTYINEEFEIPGYKSKLFIEKIWYNEEDIFVFYYIEDQDGSVFNQQKHPHLTGISLQSAKYHSGGAYTKNWLPSEGINLDDKHYKRMTFSPIEDKSTRKKLDELHEVITTTLHLNIGGESIAINDINLPFNLVPDKEYEITLEPKQTLSVNEVSILVQKITLGVSKNTAILEITNKENSEFYSIKGKVITDQNENKRFYNIDKKGSAIEITFDALNEWPSQLTFEFEKVTFFGEDTLEFTIDNEQLLQVLNNEQTEQHTIHKKLKNIRNTDVYLESIVTNKNFKIELMYQYPTNSEVYLDVQAPLSLHDQAALPMQTTVTNENGIQLELGQSGSSSNNTIMQWLNKSEVMNSEELHVRIEKLPYNIQINESIDIKIP